MSQVNRIAKYLDAVEPDRQAEPLWTVNLDDLGRQAPEVIDLVPVPPGPSNSQSLWAGDAVILMAFLAGILFGLLLTR